MTAFAACYATYYANAASYANARRSVDASVLGLLDRLIAMTECTGAGTLFSPEQKQ